MWAGQAKQKSLDLELNLLFLVCAKGLSKEPVKQRLQTLMEFNNFFVKMNVYEQQLSFPLTNKEYLSNCIKSILEDDTTQHLGFEKK